MTSFSDIFKSNFLENFTSVSILDAVITLVLSFGIGMFIFFIYKKTFSGVMYSSSFGVTLVALTEISTFVTLAVNMICTTCTRNVPKCIYKAKRTALRQVKPDAALCAVKSL